jgi:hypothetical protein
MIRSKYTLAILSTFIWIGFVSAISFMEAWLKFRASGVTLPIGLGIGRLIFGALNKMEWFFAILIIVNLYFSRKLLLDIVNMFLYAPILFLILQTTWLLPALDIRAQGYINKQMVLPSNLHFYYLGIEILKIIGLFIFGLKLIKQNSLIN